MEHAFSNPFAFGVAEAGRKMMSDRKVCQGHESLMFLFEKSAILTSLVAIFLRQRDLGENPCNEALDACEWSS